MDQLIPRKKYTLYTPSPAFYGEQEPEDYVPVEMGTMQMPASTVAPDPYAQRIQTNANRAVMQAPRDAAFKMDLRLPGVRPAPAQPYALNAQGGYAVHPARAQWEKDRAAGIIVDTRLMKVAPQPGMDGRIGDFYNTQTHEYVRPPQRYMTPNRQPTMHPSETAQAHPLAAPLPVGKYPVQQPTRDEQERASRENYFNNYLNPGYDLRADKGYPLRYNAENGGNGGDFSASAYGGQPAISRHFDTPLELQAKADAEEAKRRAYAERERRAAEDLKARTGTPESAEWVNRTWDNRKYGEVGAAEQKAKDTARIKQAKDRVAKAKAEKLTENPYGTPDVVGMVPGLRTGVNAINTVAGVAQQGYAAIPESVKANAFRKATNQPPLTPEQARAVDARGTPEQKRTPQTVRKVIKQVTGNTLGIDPKDAPKPIVNPADSVNFYHNLRGGSNVYQSAPTPKATAPPVVKKASQPAAKSQPVVKKQAAVSPATTQAIHNGISKFEGRMASRTFATPPGQESRSTPVPYTFTPGQQRVRREAVYSVDRPFSRGSQHVQQKYTGTAEQVRMIKRAFAGMGRTILDATIRIMGPQLWERIFPSFDPGDAPNHLGSR